MFYTYDVLDDILKMTDVFDRYLSEENRGRRIARKYPYVNMYDKDDTLTIRAIMPGVKSEDVDIELVDHSLILKGERKTDRKDDAYIRAERDFGCFKKVVQLPYDVDRNNVKAVLKDGILEITLVKTEAAKPKKIEIK